MVNRFDWFKHGKKVKFALARARRSDLIVTKLLEQKKKILKVFSKNWFHNFFECTSKAKEYYSTIVEYSFSPILYKTVESR